MAPPLLWLLSFNTLMPAFMMGSGEGSGVSLQMLTAIKRINRDIGRRRGH